MKKSTREQVPCLSGGDRIATRCQYETATPGRLREPHFGSQVQRAPVKRLSLTLLLAVIVSGCSTAAKFKIPSDATLFLENEKVSLVDGEYERAPFSWGATGGIPYRIEVDGRVLHEGRIRAKFRFVSIFWPPLAVIYWPMGFDKTGYDFTRPDQDNMRPKREQ